MSIKINLYDFFAYTVPGSLYLIATFYFCLIFGVLNLDWQLIRETIKDQSLLLIILSYLAGFTFDPISRYWYRRFAPLGLEKIMFDVFRVAHPDINVKFTPSDWNILHAFIRRQNIEEYSEIEKFNANKVMLRNTSFSLLLMSILTLLRGVMTSFYIWDFAVAVLLLCLSLITGNQAAKFDKWFFLAIYETMAAYGIEASDFVPGKIASPKRGSTKK